jgi:Domain of unknown function (DUF4328)
MTMARSLRFPATLAVGGLAANMLLDLVSLVIGPLSVRARLRGESGGIVTVAFSLSAVHLVAFIATGFAFVTWLLVASRNLDRWRISRSFWGTPWAIFCWVVPVVNLAAPKFVLDTVWSASSLPPDDRNSIRSSDPLILWWWLTFVVGVVGGRIYAGQVFSARDSLLLIAGANALTTIPMIISGFLAIVLIGRITRLQEARQAAIDAATPDPS